MRNPIIIIFIVLITTLLSACNSYKDQDTSEEKNMANPDYSTTTTAVEINTQKAISKIPKFSESDKDFQIGNIFLGDSHFQVHEKLGSPISSESGVYYGMGDSQLLNYNDLSVSYAITNNPDADFVYDIITSSSSIMGPREIRVGMDLSDALEEFGLNLNDIDLTETESQKTLYNDGLAFCMLFLSDKPNSGRVVFSDDRDDGVVQFEIYYSDGKVISMHLL